MVANKNVMIKEEIEEIWLNYKVILSIRGVMFGIHISL